MAAWIAFATAILTGLLAGCASENIYEGLKSREELQNPSSDRIPGQKLPSYQDYEAERKKLRGGQ